MKQSTSSRRQFLAAIGNLSSGAWLAMNWPQIAAAAEQPGAEHMNHGAHDMTPPPAKITTLSPAEAAQVDAIANLIVPGGVTPGARDAHAVYFIDNALGSFFAAQLPSFREGLIEFEKGYAGRSGGGKPFAAATEAEQIAWLKTVDKTPYFTAVRRLTVLGLVAWPKYGGNHDGLGSKLIGVIDQHTWQPPFGFYDTGYAGFVPYPGTKPYTA